MKNVIVKISHTSPQILLITFIQAEVTSPNMLHINHANVEKKRKFILANYCCLELYHM